MAKDPKVRISKFLSLVLRHKPETIGLSLDDAGWAEIADLIDKTPRDLALDRALIEEIVATNDKKRFAISEDGLRIRASQGHSVEVDLSLSPSAPPDILYHGTAERFLSSIRTVGLKPGKRQHVHLSADVVTAKAVGGRHGKPVILRIRSGLMHTAGHVFYLSDNDVWLVDDVPADYLSVEGR